MRGLTILSSLATTLSTFAAVQALTPSSVPTFEVLFVGSFTVGAYFNSINQGTFGTRIHGAITGGSLSDTSGTVVAKILPTADTGIVSNSGIFFPESVLPVIWTADNKYAHLAVQGIGKFLVSDMIYVHMETDSEQYSSLNSRFLIANVTFPVPTGDPILTIYGLL